MTQRKTADTRMDSRISPAVWAGGGIALAAALFTRLRVGSPLPLLHLLNADSILPPLWLTGLCWLSSFFLSGCAAGFIFNCRTGGCAAAWRLRGAVYGLLCLFAGLGWYPPVCGAGTLAFVAVSACRRFVRYPVPRVLGARPATRPSVPAPGGGVDVLPDRTAAGRPAAPVTPVGSSAQMRGKILVKKEKVVQSC